jgi:hypothetical protein
MSEDVSRERLREAERRINLLCVEIVEMAALIGIVKLGIQPSGPEVLLLAGLIKEWIEQQTSNHRD